ncbi:beta-lactamase/transpeptidase-like protein [Xylariaceae sp. FL1272]|nr:beta-lactamase/transpeptidase-like protein [Xylariaceae sp. FL1272]
MYPSMTLFGFTTAFLVASSGASTVSVSNQLLSYCPPLGAVLPSPKDASSHPAVKEVVEQAQGLMSELEQLLGNATGLSLGIASVHEDAPLLNVAYTPDIYNETGVSKVDSDTVFRIGSVSKVFTVMGLLLLGDKVNLADSITKYIPELNDLKKEQSIISPVTTVNWDAITLDALAAQLAGVGYDLGNDYANDPSVDLTKYGLPALTEDEHSECGAASPSNRPCTWDDFWTKFGKRSLTYGPYTTPAYSNIHYDLLGLVIERVSGQSYADYIQDTILTPLNMTRTFLTKPDDDSIGFISVGESFWSNNYGFMQADGGLYSSSNDLLKFGQGILGHKLLDEVTARLWLKPRSHTSSLGLSVGSPWEIGRSYNLTSDGRLVDVYTKNGGIPDYNAIFILIPDYDIVASIVSAGPASSLSTQLEIATIALESFTPAVEAAGKSEATTSFAGTYADEASNSSITIAIDDGPGLVVKNWTANGFNVFEVFPIISSLKAEGSAQGQPSDYLSIRLYPTGLQSNNESAWRAVYDTTSPSAVEQSDQLFIIQPSCQTWSTIDNSVYGMRGFDDFVFGIDGCTGKATTVSPRAWRQTLVRE